MAKAKINDVMMFLAVARERSFTKAAHQLGVSPSSISHTMRSLEESLGVRLLTRTTRSVSVTQAGERLLESAGPRLAEIEAELDAIGEYAVRPKGTVRITATDYAADTAIWPRLAPLLLANPDLQIEIAIDYGLADVVAQRFDLGVRNGDQVAQDMVAVRIGPDRRMVIVAAPSYLESVSPPRKPEDLLQHNCIRLRFSSGAMYAWELKKGKRETQVRVEGQAAFNNSYQMLNAALSGCGLAFVPEDLATHHVSSARLRYVMEDWFPTWPGLHAFYASRRQRSRAVELVVESLRFRSS